MFKAFGDCDGAAERRSAGVHVRLRGRVVLARAGGGCADRYLFNLDLILSRPDLFPSSACGERLFCSLCCGYIFYSERVRQLEVVRWFFSKLPFRPHFEADFRGHLRLQVHPREVLLVISMSV